jgi:hypothetical protein
METSRSSEMLVSYHNPEDLGLNLHCCEYLKTCIKLLEGNYYRLTTFWWPLANVRGEES